MIIDNNQTTKQLHKNMTKHKPTHTHTVGISDGVKQTQEEEEAEEKEEEEKGEEED